MVAQVDGAYIRSRPTKLISRLISYALFEGRPLTTSGQWINPFIFTHFSLSKMLPLVKKVKKPIFILGTGRSGTTILGIILSMHRDIGFLNEPKALWHSIYPYEDLIGSYSREPASYRLTPEDVNASVKHNAQHLFGMYLRAVFSRRLVDKYPELIFRIPFVLEIFPDAKFIFLVRNGWDTCHSIDSWSSRLGVQANGEVHDWWGVNRRKWHFLVQQLVPEHEDLTPHRDAMGSWESHTDMAMVEWVITMREGLKLLEKYPENVLRVDYEALCKQPRSILHDIAQFFELSEDETFLNYGASALKPTPEKLPFKINPMIEGPFHQTMEALGYPPT